LAAAKPDKITARMAISSADPPPNRANGARSGLFRAFAPEARSGGSGMGGDVTAGLSYHGDVASVGKYHAAHRQDHRHQPRARLREVRDAHAGRVQEGHAV